MSFHIGKSFHIAAIYDESEEELINSLLNLLIVLMIKIILLRLRESFLFGKEMILKQSRKFR